MTSSPLRKSWALSSAIARSVRTALVASAFALVVVALDAGRGGAATPLRLPLPSPDGWYVQQGYEQGTHGGYEAYALDLAHRDAPAGQLIVSPADGSIAWTDAAFGCVSIALDEALFLSLCHLADVSAFAPGEPVSAGQPLGLTAAPGDAGNGGLPHLHMALYRDPSGGSDRSQRIAIPFDGAYALSGIAFPAGEEHTGRELGAAGAPPPAAYPPQSLSAGANAVPYFGPLLPPDEAFASVADTLLAVYGWDEEGQRFRVFLPAAPAAGDLSFARPFEAYWLVVDDAATLSPGPPGSSPPGAVPLVAGLNFVAFMGDDDEATLVASRLSGTLRAAFRFDSSTGEWRVYFGDAPAASTLASFERYGTYWLVLTEATTLHW